MRITILFFLKHKTSNILFVIYIENKTNKIYHTMKNGIKQQYFATICGKNKYIKLFNYIHL